VRWQDGAIIHYFLHMHVGVISIVIGVCVLGMWHKEYVWNFDVLQRDAFLFFCIEAPVNLFVYCVFSLIGCIMG
jgi:hypothetical protein